MQQAEAQPGAGQSSTGRRVALHVGVGAVLWIIAVGVAAASVSYVVALLVCGVALGAIDAMSSHLRAGVCLVTPALLLAWWTTPRGDNDGLWLLIFPLLAVLVVLAAGCHRLGAWMGQALRGLQAS